MNGYALVVQVAGQGPKQVQFSLPRVVIGREVGDIVLKDPMASSTHAELLWDQERLTFRDLESTNGSFVLGQRVGELELTPGTVVQVGDSSIRYVGPVQDETRGRTMMQGTVVRKPGKRSSREDAPELMAVKKSGGLRLVLIAGAVVAVGGVGLGALLFGRGASTSGSGSSRSSSSLFSSAKEGEVVVKAVWFSGTPGVKVSGGTSDITVRIAPNTKDGASVGVIEEFAGGAGNQWRTATWLAAFNASRATGRSLIDHEFLVRAGGHIDGPSAGMLMTSTMMALLRGKSLLPNTTMTGTINPDGSAGPVGGIVQKMGGAKASGIARFGYPMGARNHVDLSDNRTVDLNEVGASLGLEVKEIHDLYEAYEFLTGDTIKRPTPVDESALELDADTSGHLRAKLTAWKSRLDGEVVALKTQLRRNQAIGRELGPSLNQVDEFLSRASNYEKSDLPAAALQHYVAASILVVVIRDSVELAERVIEQDLQGIFSIVDQASSITGQVNAFGDEILIRSKHTTVGGQVNTTRAFQAYVASSNYSALGEDGRARALEALNAIKAGKVRFADALTYVLKNTLYPIAYFHMARVMLDLSRDLQDLSGEEGQASAANLARLGREAGAYGSAAGAGLAYFDAILLEAVGKEKGMSKGQVQAFFAEKEVGYLLAMRAAQLTESIKAGEAEGGKNLLRLAAGVSAYIASAGLVNKYYSLNAQENKDGSVTIQNRKSLSAQLEQARLHARETAALAQSIVHFIPVGAKLDYQIAGALREGSDADKLEALEHYWQSAFWSELAATLGKQ